MKRGNVLDLRCDDIIMCLTREERNSLNSLRMNHLAQVIVFEGFILENHFNSDGLQ